jgi:SHAQKYF class myb-like DNA-binding protein
MLLEVQGKTRGRWMAEEHHLFLQGLDEYGKGWKKIAALIKSRTVVQIRTHAQKYKTAMMMLLQDDAALKGQKDSEDDFDADHGVFLDDSTDVDAKKINKYRVSRCRIRAVLNYINKVQVFIILL